MKPTEEGRIVKIKVTKGVLILLQIKEMLEVLIIPLCNFKVSIIKIATERQ